MNIKKEPGNNTFWPGSGESPRGGILLTMSRGSFDTTRWTMIRTARAKGEPGSAEALAGLCEAYWYPLYVFVRRMGNNAEDARDLTQGYFLRLMEKDYLDSVREDAGKFRFVFQ